MLIKQNKTHFELEKVLWNVSVLSVLLLLIFARNLQVYWF